MTCITRSIPIVLNTFPNIFGYNMFCSNISLFCTKRKNLLGKATCGQKRHTSNPTKLTFEQHLQLARFPEVRKDTLETQRLGDQIRREIVPWSTSVGQPWPRVEDRKVTPPRTTVARTNTLNRMCMMTHLCCIRPISSTRQCNSTMNCNHLSVPLQIATVGTMNRMLEKCNHC
jgi:hypothetical protein